MRHGVILAGGGGARLWPASRRACPKPFLPAGSAHRTLLRATYERLIACTHAITVVAAVDHVDLIRSELPIRSQDRIIAEPLPRNTAAAIGLAAVSISHDDSDAILGIVPSDHYVGDENKYAEVMEAAFSTAARSQQLVTVGIVPTQAETGYGYLKLALPPSGEANSYAPVRVESFVEKPDAGTARDYVDSGRYLWNGGMFFARADALLASFDEHMPDLAAALTRIARALGSKISADQAVAAEYPSLVPLSFDKGVMEKLHDSLCIPGDFGWNDVGTWQALSATWPRDDANNATLGAALLLEAHDNIVYSDDGTLIAALGINNMVVAKAGNAILIVPRERCQDVRKVVAALESKKFADYT